MIPIRMVRTTVEFDTPVKALAMHQFMQTNNVDFQTATDLLGYQHGVDFIMSVEEIDAHAFEQSDLQ